jgi:hypothetical protein
MIIIKMNISGNKKTRNFTAGKLFILPILLYGVNSKTKKVTMLIKARERKKYI